MAKKKKKVEEVQIEGLEIESSIKGNLDDLSEDEREALSRGEIPESLLAQMEVPESEAEVEEAPAEAEEELAPEVPEPEFVLPDIVMQELGGITPEMLELIRKVNEGSPGQVLQLRRKIRYRLFRIRDGGRIAEQHDLGLKAHMEAQFSPGMSWTNFTFEWDVAPNNPLEVIHKSIHNYDWIAKGGTFDGADKRYPPAFTKQS